MSIIICNTDLLVIVGTLQEAKKLCKSSNYPIDKVKHVYRLDQLKGLSPPLKISIVVGETIDNFSDREEIGEFLNICQQQDHIDVYYL